MSSDSLMVERKRGTGHYVISAFVVDKDNFEYLHSVSFWGYGSDDLDSIKEMFLNYLQEDGLVLS